GLAIDYSLFVVSRFREELAAGRNTHDAVINTVDTAGRTVAFSALTVAVSLAALMLFPMYFLRSFAYAGVLVVLVSMTAALVSLPALLAVLGPRVNAGRIGRRRRERAVEDGLWHKVATAVMRRPVIVAGTVIAVLVVLGSPFARASFGLPDDRVMPTSAEARQVSDAIRRDYDGQESNSFGISLASSDPMSTEVARYGELVSSVVGVARVDTAQGSFIRGSLVAGPSAASARFTAAGTNGTWVSVVPSIDPDSGAGEQMVKAIRSIESPIRGQVSGAAAELVDTKASIADRLPWAALWIAISTFVLLFLSFGSVLVPLKAIVLNLLSLSATFGAMVWIFQDGNGADLLGFTSTGNLDVSMPILMFCVAFGLSMDYEVFLLSRIKEEYDRTGDNASSVAHGLERTGRIVTAAAALMAVTFIAFGTSSVTFLKLFGFGLALAVIVDATIVRGALVPAFMRLAGNANWWAPPAMRRFHDRFGFSEHGGSGHTSIAAAADVDVDLTADHLTGGREMVGGPRR
ncbi:MAG: MMPL family transporter, partial [Acidimicrobiia bacterium]